MRYLPPPTPPNTEVLMLLSKASEITNKNIYIFHLHSYSNFIFKMVIINRVFPILQISWRSKKVSELWSSEFKSCPHSITSVCLLNRKLLVKMAVPFEHCSETTLVYCHIWGRESLAPRIVCSIHNKLVEEGVFER